MKGQPNRYNVKPVGPEFMYWAFWMFDRMVISLELKITSFQTFLTFHGANLFHGCETESVRKFMKKCHSNFEKNETVAFGEWDTAPRSKKGRKPIPDYENIPDKCVIIHNEEPLGVWDSTA